MKILITGTAGFIGNHLALRLLSKGHEVVGIDNFNDYYSVALKSERHKRLEAFPTYAAHRFDLSEFDKLKAVFDEFKPDRVCHLAAQAGVRYSLANPFAYLKSNLEAFLNMLEVCRHADPQPRLVYASSSSVYGGNVKLPLSEHDRVDTPISLYAATKKSDELMAHCYSHLYGLQTVGLRFFTVYGPWGRPDMALWLFTEAMLEDRPIKVFNHGEMQRDFTYIDDIVQGVVASLFTDTLEHYEVINLGNHKSEKLLDMIHILAAELGVTPKMQMMPMQPGDVPATYADIEKARAKLGFEPTTPIRDGIPKFVEWYRNYNA